MATDTRIGTRIARRRHVLGWTQQQLADAVGVSKSTVANWERGKHFPQRYIGKVESVLGIELTAMPDEPVISPELRGMINELTAAEREWVKAELAKAERRLRRREDDQEPGAPAPRQAAG